MNAIQVLYFSEVVTPVTGGIRCKYSFNVLTVRLSKYLSGEEVLLSLKNYRYDIISYLLSLSVRINL